jgi:ring-1,2-phenylacetyl-CoA epoxidase subunit PaaE
MASARFHDLKITAIRKPSSGSTALSFELPDHLKDTFAFTPGQYLTLRAQIAGEDIRRSYSICSARSEDHLEVGIKQVEGGRFSNYAATLKIGDTVQVLAPQGRFTVAIDRSANVHHDYLLLASGSGITPCLSIAKSVLEEEAASTISLVYGNRATVSTMFLDDIISLKDRFTRRIQVVYTFSREQSDTPLFNGRLDGGMVDVLVDNGIIDVTKYDAAYICGPHGMIESVQSKLESAGMAKAAIKFELFSTPDSPAQSVAAPAPQSRSGAEVSIVLDGKHATFPIAGTRGGH